MSLKVRLLLGAAAPFVFAMPALAQVHDHNCNHNSNRNWQQQMEELQQTSK